MGNGMDTFVLQYQVLVPRTQAPSEHSIEQERVNSITFHSVSEFTYQHNFSTTNVFGVKRMVGARAVRMFQFFLAELSLFLQKIDMTYIRGETKE